jgi:hypothetical protein
MDDDECSKFVLEHFGSEVHLLYETLPQPIMRADFWRIAVVYIHGGYYSDLDIICNKNINEFINPEIDGVFMQERDNISNYFFGAVPHHPVLKNTLDDMISEMRIIIDKDTQSFGMHPLHKNVRGYYEINDTNYVSNDSVQFLSYQEISSSNTLIHFAASLQNDPDYESWRSRNNLMNEERQNCENILFFTTFNKNGYNLYGKTWIRSFMAIANYYNKFRAKIYYEGFEPTVNHPSIEWITYETAVPFHDSWKKDYLNKTTHSDYIQTMTVRFSHKAFVIQHVLESNDDDYLIWLDGDCIFKNADYTGFPKQILNNKFLACQVEHAQDLNHVESGILIFQGGHSDIAKFNEHFKHWYQVENILPMGEPYDGFIVFKSLLTSGVTYVDLNQDHGRGGIQSDPSMTFCHPEIHDKFIHNIGWTGKNQYSNWERIYQQDSTYQRMHNVLFGNSQGELLALKTRAHDKLQQLRKLKK